MSLFIWLKLSYNSWEQETKALGSKSRPSIAKVESKISDKETKANKSFNFCIFSFILDLKDKKGSFNSPYNIFNKTFAALDTERNLLKVSFNLIYDSSWENSFTSFPVI